MLRRVVWQKLTDTSDMFTVSIIRATTLMMKAVTSSKMSVKLCHTTRRGNPEDSRLHTRRCENLKYRLLLKELKFCKSRIHSHFPHVPFSGSEGKTLSTLHHGYYTMLTA